MLYVNDTSIKKKLRDMYKFQYLIGVIGEANRRKKRWVGRKNYRGSKRHSILLRRQSNTDTGSFSGTHPWRHPKSQKSKGGW